MLLGGLWEEVPFATLSTVLLGLPQAACEVLLPPQSLWNPRKCLWMLNLCLFFQEGSMRDLGYLSHERVMEDRGPPAGLQQGNSVPSLEPSLVPILQFWGDFLQGP